MVFFTNKSRLFFHIMALVVDAHDDLGTVGPLDGRLEGHRQGPGPFRLARRESHWVRRVDQRDVFHITYLTKMGMYRWI